MDPVNVVHIHRNQVGIGHVNFNGYRWRIRGIDDCYSLSEANMRLDSIKKNPQKDYTIVTAEGTYFVIEKSKKAKPLPEKYNKDYFAPDYRSKEEKSLRHRIFPRITPKFKKLR